jgi:hypothetical protein
MKFNICVLQQLKLGPVPGSLDEKGGRKFYFLFNKIWQLLPTFLSNEPNAEATTSVLLMPY